MLPTPIVAAVVAPLVLWRVYSRIKRLTSRQQSKTWRHRTTLVFFPLLVLALAAGAVLTGALPLIALAAGLPLGVVLGRIAIGKTRFEQVGDTYYFTPHAPIGMLIALLIALQHHEFATSPLTLFIFGLLAGYYMTYAFGLLAWRRKAALSAPLLNPQ